VRDALTLSAAIRDDNKHSARRILVVGVEGAGVIAATATAMSPSTVDQLGCDTGGFRFAQLDNAWDVNFLPGAAKYGDVPAILSLCSSVNTTLLGETRGSVTGVASAFAVGKGQIEFAGTSKPNPVNIVVNALTGPK
jgi:hypothetical protein